MASITTRETGTTGVGGVTRKNLPLTNAEIDNNFISLNNNKLENSNNLSDIASASTARTNLGLGTIATQASNSVSITGGSITGITDLAVADGGTGLSSSAGAGFLLIGNTSNTWTAARISQTPNQVLVTNGNGTITLSTPQDIATSSNPQFGSLGIGTAASGTAGEIRATNAITSYYSDERLKENIELIDNALNKVISLRGVTYNANHLAESFGYTNKEKQVGLLAGDVKKVLPEAVKPAPFDLIRIDENTEISRSGENYQTVQYEKLVPLLIESVKELRKEISLIKKQLDSNDNNDANNS
jgi:hypothetical protein